MIPPPADLDLSGNPEGDAHPCTTWVLLSDTISLLIPELEKSVERIKYLGTNFK